MTRSEMPRRRRVLRGAAFVFGVISLVAAVLLPVSFVSTRSIGTSRHAVVLHRGRVEIASFSSAFVRSGEVWVSASGPRILVGASSEWRPSRARAGIVVSGPTGAPVTTSLDVVYVPLGFVVGVMAVPAVGLWVMARRSVPAGMCRGCGYDLAGTRGERCPECGREGSAARRVARSIGRALRWRGGDVPASVAGIS
jgi:hypothetical protein